MKRNRNSMLMAGVPPARGAPVHYEHTDDTAYTAHDCETGGVSEVHTPQDSLRRIHELMHARHSPTKEQSKWYAGIIEPVRQVTEDCRIHLLHWPWDRGHTPADIANDALEFVTRDVARCVQECDEIVASGKRTAADMAWPIFATKLRAVAVTDGVSTRGYQDLTGRMYEGDEPQEALAVTVLDLLVSNKPRAAALMLQRAFFDVPEEEASKGERGGKKGEGGTELALHMDVIELPHTEPIREAEVGTRVATSGPRIHRPALRRPVLPQRMFVRRSAVEPQGTILIDASGSMGDFSYVERIAREAPFATVAYYAGEDDGKHGQLFVYARGGMRSADMPEPDTRGNLVDGPALDWLLKQDPPRIMVTDRGFCGAADSAAQIVRLARLEAAGEVTVRNYKEDA